MNYNRSVFNALECCFVSPKAGKLSYGAAVYVDRSDVNPVLAANLQGFGLPRGTQHGAQVTLAGLD